MGKYVPICVPASWPYVPTKFFYNCFKLISRGGQDGYTMNLVYSTSPFMDTCRDELMEAAIKAGADYILFLDADQLYPLDTVSRLAKHIDDGKLVVGGMTPHRTEGRAILFDWKPEDPWQGKWNQTIGPDTGVVKVGGMGFGGVMVSPKVAEIIPFPRFEMVGHPEFHYKIGEDVAFYKKCADNGIDVWCDTSLRNKHLNFMELEIQKREE